MSHRLRKQACGFWGEGTDRSQNAHEHMAMFNVGDQQGPTV